jgi:HEAT repeat protein
VEAIKGLASSSSPTLRLAGHSALIRITGDSSAGLPVMLNALKNPDAEVRRLALQSLGELGSTTKPPAASIVEHLTDPSAAVRAEAVLALARIDATGPQIVQALSDLLRDPEGEVRVNAAMALAKLAPTSQEAQAVLQTAEADPDPRVMALVKAGLESVSRGR